MNAPDPGPSRVCVTRTLPDAGMRELETLPGPVDVHHGDGPPSRAELLDAVAGASGLVTLLTESVDEELLTAAGPDLRVVANCAVGYDNIDVDAAARRGVVVTNTPDVLDEATADLAVTLMLAASRRVVEADRYLRAGNQWIWDPRLFLGLDLSAGATVGIVGLGRIGLAVARRANAFGMRLAAHRISESCRAEADALGVTEVPLPTLLSSSDVVTLHCPLTPRTHHLIGAAELDAMPSHAVLVNTARGPVVDEAALVDALERGAIGAAALDVFEHEPRVHPRLLELDNVIAVPHIASAGHATRDAMATLAVRNVAAVLAGRPPLTPVRERSSCHS
ncbi:lactate dehydrogenase-like 2-hydroxyacid dehydrogenase [Haloactinopolyspora alba]|uniref:Lactate dehydrogenase-like 2-hydroxyacid dehydrogenase n=1 Tax=Haloactinopolyspora alba TaxID=648780 RepID=A0A2P8EF16_9ACTN|nr:D-glycerate dehydrogenase [Haloactinopolyspora alba]PSL08055.1 lactate dehydrogenase-like 2-hydroxyacid dehydrogenase [Haloactinopolyspora alba]